MSNNAYLCCSIRRLIIIIAKLVQWCCNADTEVEQSDIFWPQVTPIFNLTEFPVTQPGLALANFHAYRRKPTEPNGFEYFILPESDPKRRFEIGQYDGQLRVVGTLDREEKDHYLLRIGARDSVGRTAYSSVTISVLDINDNAPEIVLLTPARIKENMPPGTIVTSLNGKDADGPGNGAPFQFRITDTSMETLFELIPRTDGGVNMISKTVFDHEKVTSFLVPLWIGDSGLPQLSSEMTLEVLVVDENDNPMEDTWKSAYILLYNGQLPQTMVAKVEAIDRDRAGFTLLNKQFSVVNGEIFNRHFVLNSTDGQLYIRENPPEGIFEFSILITDTVEGDSAKCHVQVSVDHIPDEAVNAAGSLRIYDVKMEELFVPTHGRAPLILLATKISDILRSAKDSVQLFFGQSTAAFTDIYFAIRHREDNTTTYWNPQLVESSLALQLEDLRTAVKNKPLELGAGQCGASEQCFDCRNRVEPNAENVVVQIDSFKFISFLSRTVAVCGNLCSATPTLYSSQEQIGCTKTTCRGNGICHNTGSGSTFCECRHPNFQGSRCEATVRHFTGNNDSYVWLSPLIGCGEFSFSLKFATTKPDGVIFYTGPFSVNKPSQNSNQDLSYLALFLRNGEIVLVHGAGGGVEMEMKLSNLNVNVTDGKWYTTTILWTKQLVEIAVDNCKSNDNHDGDWCLVQRENNGRVLSLLKILQIGGLAQSPSTIYPSILTDISNTTTTGFTGCLKDFIFKGQVLDFSNYLAAEGSELGCQPADKFCVSSTNTIATSCVKGRCVSDLSGNTSCECYPWWTGADCNTKRPWVYFDKQSHLRLVHKDAATLQPQEHHKTIDFLFVPSSVTGTILLTKAVSERSLLHAQIQSSKFRVDYPLLSTDKRVASELQNQIQLHNQSNQFLNQSYWLRLERFGSALRIYIDGVVVLLSTDASNVTVTELLFGVEQPPDRGDFQGCISSVRWDFAILDLLTPGVESPFQVATQSNVRSQCPLLPSCAQLSSVCVSPFVCIELWKGAFCTCPLGQFPVLDDRGTLQGCDETEGGAVVVAVAVVAYKFPRSALLAVCLFLAALLLVFFVIATILWEKDNKKLFPILLLNHNNRSETVQKIVDYMEEAGEVDQENYDISQLRQRIADEQLQTSADAIAEKRHVAFAVDSYSDTERLRLDQPPTEVRVDKPVSLPPPDLDDLAHYISVRKDVADSDPMAKPYDELRRFRFEGDGLSVNTDLSSIEATTSNDRNDIVEFDKIIDREKWGKKFSVLSAVVCSNGSGEHATV